ncbi:putative ubx domain protein [Golovinomyces cichoracearum]|uniref:Putative ubx domain protein n=1 Tax=Golovinomyces cichoracearum TaxID=62708 RepID=A0A420I9Q2_9PEZI|nr:putative ubx domain protein [Golovinomyces cichoracearum]
MASHVIVVDTTLKRAIVKVTPGNYLSDILEEACEKLGVQPTQYSLKHNNKSLDLSRTFRLSGLSSGARLELILASRSPTPVSVALQLPPAYTSSVPNGRITECFSSNTTLWLILRKFESMAGTNMNFTARRTQQQGEREGSEEGSLSFYERPVLNIMGREVWKFGDLQKTLRQLGFSNGTCLIKLDFRKTNQPYEEVMIQIKEYFEVEYPLKSEKEIMDQNPHGSSESDKKSARESSELLSEEQKMISTEVNSGEKLKTDCITKFGQESTEPLICNPADRQISVYAPPSTQLPRAATVPYNSGDFEPTTAHAKLHQSRLSNSSQNKRLLSDAEIENLNREKAEKLANTSRISIKIRFPDQSSILSSFLAKETGANLYQFTTGLIVDESRPFKLTWHDRGPKRIPNNNKQLVKDLGFQNRMLINFSWENGAEISKERALVLKPEYTRKAEEIPVPNVAVDEVADIKEPTEKEINILENKKQKVVGKWFKGLIKN